MEKTFSKKAAFSYGWEAFKKDPIFWIAVILGVPIALSLADTGIGMLIGKQYSLISGGVSFLVGLISVVVQIGILAIVLDQIDGKEKDWRDIYRKYPLFLKFIVSSVLYGLIVIGGLILFIVPGIIWSLKFGLYTYLIVDKNAGPIEALKMSSRITQGVKWQLLLFNFLAGLIIIAGLLALVLGVFVAVPVVTLAGAWVYRKLEQQTNAVQETPVSDVRPA